MTSPDSSGPEALGPFRLLRRIAGADGGAWFEAEDPELGHRLAVRVFENAGVRPDRRWHDGVEAASALQHPNLVAVHDGGWQDGMAYVALALVDGEPLADVLARVGRLPVLQGLALAMQLLSAVEHAHARGVVHGALSGRHLLVARNGRLKVTGFGWASAAPGAPAATVHGTTADLRAAAALAHLLLTGAAPGGEGLRPVRTLRPELPPELDAVFARALDAAHPCSYASAGLLASALRDAVRGPVWVRGAVPQRGDVAEVIAVAAPAAPADMPAAPQPNRGDGLAPVAARWRGRVSQWLPSPWLGAAAATYAGVVVLASTLVGQGDAGLQVQPRAAGAPAVAAAPGPAEPLRQAEATLGEREEVQQWVRAPVTAAAPVPPTAVLPVPALAQAAPAAPPTLVQAGPSARAPEPAEMAPPPAARADRDAADPGPRQRGAAAPRPAAARTEVRRTALRAESTQAGRVAVGCRQDWSVGRDFCVVVRCATAEFRSHPLCVRMHAEARARDPLTKVFSAP